MSAMLVHSQEVDQRRYEYESAADTEQAAEDACDNADDDD